MITCEFKHISILSIKILNHKLPGKESTLVLLCTLKLLLLLFILLQI